MARYALLIDYDYCTGCHSCEIACQQEHDYPVGTNGVVIREYEYEANGRVRIDFLPFFTQHCDLCKGRRARERDAVTLTDGGRRSTAIRRQATRQRTRSDD
jgi:Fe-S-cluster-containing dehydrogenase component